MQPHITYIYSPVSLARTLRPSSKAQGNHGLLPLSYQVRSPIYSIVYIRNCIQPFTHTHTHASKTHNFFFFFFYTSSTSRARYKLASAHSTRHENRVTKCGARSAPRCSISQKCYRAYSCIGRARTSTPCLYIIRRCGYLSLDIAAKVLLPRAIITKEDRCRGTIFFLFCFTCVARIFYIILIYRRGQKIIYQEQ